MNSDRHKLTVDSLYAEVRNILEQARVSAFRAVNFAMVQAYWQVGRLIVEHEQKGKERAEYGKTVLKTLSHRLTVEFGKGFTLTNLKYMRQFYLAFPKGHALSDQSPHGGKSHAAGDQSSLTEKRDTVRNESAEKFSVLRSALSWTHYRLLLRIEDQQARLWYMNEAADQNWSTRQLDRQISTLYYERLLASREKTPVRTEAAQKLAEVEPDQFIRDPYVLEFLNLKDYPGLREEELESALIDNLQQFLLELGKGFSFVARQKRLMFDDEHFYVDLVFYNYLLKCFILIDLKIGKLTH